MTNISGKKNISTQQVVTALLDLNNIFPPSYLRHFSDLEGADLEILRAAWPQVNPTRRFTILEDLEDLAELDTLVYFDNVARMALTDEDPRVRTVAIRLLWEADDTDLARIFMKMLDEDPSADVRAAAATALGGFIYLGELEEIPEDLHHQIEDRLMQVYASEAETLVRRRALESLGFSGRTEVPDIIRSAYRLSDPDWQSSALFAMGRSADQAWGPDVLRMLRSPKANIQLEAVRAAGELSLESTRRILLDLLEEEAQDSDIRAATIWSLSQIGGEEVRETLEQLQEESEDEEEIQILEEALDNLSFTEDVGLYGMFDLADMGSEADQITNFLSNEEIEKLGDESRENPDSAEETKPEKNRPRHRKSK